MMTSFAGIILLGTLLLMLPLSTTGPRLSFVDALFTATSATCVTGLIVVDTATAFTPFGQTVILILIQLGGLGIMTFSTFFLYLLGYRLSLGTREVLQETFTHRPTRHFWPLMKTVFLATISVEGIGALLLWLRFAADMPVGKALYMGIFHSVSAFCNAGFALFSDSFMGYQGDPFINLILMGLIVLGGLGFVVIFDVIRHLRNPRRPISLHSRLVLWTSGSLIIGGALLIFILEFNNALKGLPWPTRLWGALFQSVTTRTAGFNTLDISSMTNATLFLMILLMIVGASPGSCGGGIKTTTFAVLLSLIRARFQNREEVDIFHRRMPTRVVSKAISISFFSLVLINLGTILLLITELAQISHQHSRGMFLELLFEVSSAFATVGLSTGVTGKLSATGRLIITALMYIGRLGPLTVALAVGSKEQVHYKQAEEEVQVG
ncbi:MAG: hypothetical protein D6681_11010 [Calditrichaeota bacterium]|nr:MAG: hypothetical protein D6681_11010 [Calditrichota bacterium]